MEKHCRNRAASSAITSQRSLCFALLTTCHSTLHKHRSDYGNISLTKPGGERGLNSSCRHPPTADAALPWRSSFHEVRRSLGLPSVVSAPGSGSDRAAATHPLAS